MSSRRRSVDAAVLILAFCLLLTGCTGVPSGITPVQGFEPERYLGTWYEIARLDHSFERGLRDVTAEYSPLEGGGIRVVNRGYAVEDGEWKVAEGRAYFVSGEDSGHLKVSFFGPFYGSYVIFGLDEDYRHAFVTSYEKSYLWLLARTPNVEQGVIDEFLRVSKRNGFATGDLIFVAHEQDPAPRARSP